MDYAHDLLSIISTAQELFEGSDPEYFELSLTAGGWTKKQILGHLIDSGINNYSRFVKANYQEHLRFDRYNQDKSVALNDYNRRSVQGLFDIWTQINVQIAALLNNLDPHLTSRETIAHNFDKICMKPVNQSSSVSLDYLIWDYLFHLEHHLSQIFENYEKGLSEYNS